MEIPEGRLKISVRERLIAENGKYIFTTSGLPEVIRNLSIEEQYELSSVIEELVNDIANKFFDAGQDDIRNKLMHECTEILKGL